MEIRKAIETDLPRLVGVATTPARNLECLPRRHMTPSPCDILPGLWPVAPVARFPGVLWL